ncbi:mannosyltransferase [Croceitalea sp. P059]|uniref:mannosyltransferase n=1 Tax=Croceitalea sp. P059 TaxID=3075601 RepID=UPI00288471A8|nr:mannosyltransferase [Croceitalea sp. P059]MDT0538283.1 mannosyltransferase [Croceitalea sp. P059]
MLTFWKVHKISILLVLGSLMFYKVFAYDLQRDDFTKLITLFAALFFFCFQLIKFEKWNFKFLLVTGLLFRLVFLIAEPNLSQDFYRFIWDGELIKNGINPYLYTPNTLIEKSDLTIANAQQLYDGMGSLSARHYSNYPPLNQIIFTISSFLSGGSILGSLIVMRITTILADIGILYFGRKLLQNLGRSNHLAFWFFLNPLVIIELTGNLHFEGVMLFFFVWAIYLISTNKWKQAAPIYAFSILLKLVPILFLPLFLKHLGLKKSTLFYSLIGITCIAFLLPFYSSEFIANYSKTVGLWFSNFEFNASVYNLVKKIGVLYFEAKPWELVKSYGSLIPKVIITLALLLTFFRKNQNIKTLMNSMLILLSSYYFLSSTVHPWYIIFLLILGILTNYRFPIVWCLLVILSYYAYTNPGFKENLWLLTIEYCLVLGYLGFEVFKNRNIMSSFRKKFNLN